jgi:hypothetical protein
MKTCKICKTPLDGKRGNAQTCSDACRQAYKRRSSTILQAENHIMSDLQVLRHAIKNYPEMTQQITEQLKYFQGEIRDLLVLAKEPDALARMEMLNGRKNK